ncbi:hypothetical protein GCM10009624_34500 [Gordonia sinesedis]
MARDHDPTPRSDVAAAVMIIRHAEKPTGSVDVVTINGHHDPESLTVTGWVRAGGLIGLFGADGQEPGRGLARPDRVIASVGGSASRRPLETVTPLAARLDDDPIVRFTKQETAAAAAFAAAQPGITLMCWQHEEIPNLVNGFGAVLPAPPPWPDDRFDMVWVVRPDRTDDGGGATGTRWSLTILPQMLLAGDRPV